jgi:hypothetical protein
MERLITHLICILYPQNPLPSRLSREEVVVERRSQTANVQ